MFQARPRFVNRRQGIALPWRGPARQTHRLMTKERRLRGRLPHLINFQQKQQPNTSVTVGEDNMTYPPAKVTMAKDGNATAGDCAGALEDSTTGETTDTLPVKQPQSTPLPMQGSLFRLQSSMPLDAEPPAP